MLTRRDMLGWDAKNRSSCSAWMPLFEEVATRMAGSLRSLSASVWRPHP